MALQNYQLKAVKTAALILGALTPLVIAQHGWSGPVGFDLIAMSIWLVSPYVCLFVVTELLERFSSIKKIFHINCVIAILIFAFSIWAYSIALDETSSTSGLIFIFGPMWVYITSFFALGFALLFIKLASKNP